MIPVIYKFQDADEASRALAQHILESSILKHDKYFNIAVSGGRTPKMLFTMLAEESAFRLEIPWHRVRFFWVDERCVEPTDPDSNYGMTYDALLQYAFVPSSNIFRMKGEDIPENEAERYRQLLMKELPARNGMPVFDLVILGLGEDGHTASIFPDQMELLDSDYSVEIGIHPQSKQKRITLTGRAICEASQVVSLVCGLGKAEILNQIVNKTGNYQDYPASHVQASNGTLLFYLDKAAASGL